MQYAIYLLVLSPLEILVYSIFFKECGYDYVNRIFGHYRFNFTFSIVRTQELIIDALVAIFDFSIIYLPFQLNRIDLQVSFIGGKNISFEGLTVFHMLTLQAMSYAYYRKTTITVHYSMNVIFVLKLICMALIFDEEGILAVS